MDQPMQAALLGVLRHLMTGVGGALVAEGYATNDQVTAVVTSLIGVASFFIGVAWSWWQKREAERQKQAAVATAVAATATGPSIGPVVRP